MQSIWVRDNTSRLVRQSDLSLPGVARQLDFSSPTKIESKEVEVPTTVMAVSLKERCYPARTAQPSCIVLPAVTANNFEIKHHNISMLPRFAGVEGEDPYLFIREFEEVCALQKLQQLSEDSIRLRLINFALKEDAKQWLYSLPVNSISTWEGFVAIFLKKYFPNHKANRLRNEINQFQQNSNEPFWKYFDRFQKLLSKCPQHGIEKWRLCKILYEALDSQTTALLESMCNGRFMDKTDEEAWQFFEELAERTMLWESTREPSQETEKSKGVHVVGNSIATEAKLATLTRRLEALETNKVSSQVFLCANCNSPTHLIENCPEIEQANAMFQSRVRNDPYSSTYNPGWKNHPNFSWNQGQYNQYNQNSQPAFQKPNPGPYPTQNPNSYPPQNLG